MHQLHQTLFQYASSTLYRMDECDRVERAGCILIMSHGDAACVSSDCSPSHRHVHEKSKPACGSFFYNGTGSVAEAFHSQAMATAHGDKSVTIMVCHKENIRFI